MTDLVGNVTIDPPQFNVTVAAPPSSDIIVVPVSGPTGPRGQTGGEVFEYTMSVAQTTALFNHNLGRNPVAVQVLVDGAEMEEFSVSYPLDGQSVLVGFDIPLLALIRLL